MCLTVKKGCGVRVAHRDIKCWKVVYVTSIDSEVWMAPIRGTIHGFDESLSIDMPLKVIRYVDHNSKMKVREIEKGFHAYKGKESAMAYVGYCRGRIVAECTIPKGAEYCYGMYNEIVANKMIVHKPKCVK